MKFRVLLQKTNFKKSLKTLHSNIGIQKLEMLTLSS